MEIILISILVLVVAVQEWRHEREKRDLWNRLMAKDFREYSVLTKPKKTQQGLPGYMTEEEMYEEEQRRLKAKKKG